MTQAIKRNSPNKKKPGKRKPSRTPESAPCQNKDQLELINEELGRLSAKLEAALRQYTDLYDFAPVGYLMLGRDGTVCKANLPAAILMNVDYAKLVHQRLGELVSDESVPVFNSFLENLLTGTGREICELKFTKDEASLVWVQIEATCFEGGEESRAVLVDISERKRMERILQESESRFRTTLQEVLTIAVQGYALDGTTQFWNTASENLYGYSADEALGQNLLELIIPPEMRSNVRIAIQQMAETGQPIPAAELSLMRKDGSRVSVYSSHVIVPHSDRGPELFCLDVDLTERKRIAALLHARVKISEFADTHTIDDVLQKTLDEAEALTNSQVGFAHFLEADQKTLQFQSWSTNTIKRDQCSVEGKGRHLSVDEASVWADCIATREPLIHNDFASLPHRNGLPDGHIPLLRELIVPVLRNNLVVMLMGVGNKPESYNNNDVETFSQLANTAWDIIQRKQVEEALKASERKYRLLHESMIDGFVSVDMEGNFLDCNEVYRNMLGYSQAEFTRITYVDITPEKWHSFEEDIVKNQILPRGYSDIYEKEYIRKDGTVFPVELHTVLLPDEEGKPAGMWAIARDITKRKQAEKALETANIELQTALAREKELAQTDALTGINNRRYLYELAEHEFEIAIRYQKPLAVIMFDIDHFKQVNDTFGHIVGDRILQTVTQDSHSELRAADVIGRYGGEEFVILLPMTTAQQAYMLAERIRKKVEEIRVPTEKGDASITLSIGIIELKPGEKAASVEELIRAADQAMYNAKEAGRNCTHIGLLGE